MAEQDTNDAPTDDTVTKQSEATVDGPSLMVSAQYIKDLSVEVPGAPTIYTLMQNNKPDVSVHIDVNVQPIQDKVYEVALIVKSDCKLDGQVAFLVELSYAGVFTLTAKNEQIEPMLLIECPRLLFPFARNIVADATRDAGFPPVLLSPVDFLALYNQQKQNQQNAASNGGNGGDQPADSK